jgi:hypothetical protein
MAEEDDDLAYWLAREYANARKEIVGTMTTMKRGPKAARGKSSLNSLRSRARSACSVSDCELTDTYSPAAIDMAPGTSPATPAINTSFCVAAAAETPRIKLAVERMPSLAPSTAALNHPMRLTKWFSGFGGTRRIRHSACQIKADP